MQYRSRYLYMIAVFSLMIAAGYFFDLQDQLSSLSNLRQRYHANKLALQQSSAMESVSAAVLAPDRRIDLLSTAVALSRDYGVNIKNIMPQHHNNTTDSMHVVAEADYLQIVKMMERLSRYPNPVIIKNVVFKALTSERIYAEFDLQAFAVTLPVVKQSDAILKNSINPFCASPSTLILARPVQTIMTVALNQMRSGGIIQSGCQQYGLIALPNGDVIDVRVGVVIGKERGRVVSISADKVVVRLVNKKQIIIRA